MALIFEKVLVQHPCPILHINIVNPTYFLELWRRDVARYTAHILSLAQEATNNLEAMSRLWFRVKIETNLQRQKIPSRSPNPFPSAIHSCLLNAPSKTASRMPQKKPAANPLQQEPAGHPLALGIKRRWERKARQQQLSNLGRHWVRTKISSVLGSNWQCTCCEVTFWDAFPLKIILNFITFIWHTN